MKSDRRMTRRRVLGLAGGLGLGVAGAVALAGCGGTQAVEEIVPQTVLKVVTKEVKRPTEVPAEKTKQENVRTARPLPRPLRWPGDLTVRFMTDHTHGPRGAAMLWGLKRFEDWQPDITVRFEPQSYPWEKVDVMFDAGTEPHLILSEQSSFLPLHQDEHLTEISRLLTKFGVIEEDYYYVPDSYTYNNVDHSVPQRQLMDGPQYGMPFQMMMSGFVANASLAENAGVQLPASENSWTWDDWIEWDAVMTDPETGTFGTWARDDYQFQYMPQMYSTGLKKPFDDELTKTMFDQPQALRAWEYLISKIHVHKTAPPLDRIKEVAGEYGNPFVAGNIGLWPSGRVYSTGFSIPRIKDRFEWTLLPAVRAPGGGPAVHSWSDQGHLVTRAASLDYVVEAATALAVFLASEAYQRQVGIERGHMPVHKAAIGAPESLAPPPQGMKWLKYYADRPDNRSLFPFNTWREWYDGHRELARKGWTGEQTPAEALEACQAWGVEHLSTYEGPRPYVREPVYA